jgi:hypothetical protein
MGPGWRRLGLVMRRSLRYALAIALGACVVQAGCAWVLDVDKSYQLVDGGPGQGAEPGIRCALDAAPCTSGSQECCLASNYALSCVSTSLANPCPQGTDIRCDQPADCPGGVCCISLDTGNDILGTTCRSSCTTGETELCAQQGGTCTHGSCVALTIQPSPPIHNPWFYGCQ